MSNYQDSISSANKAGAVIAGSAACWAKLTHGAAVPGNRRQAPGRSTALRLPGVLSKVLSRGGRCAPWLWKGRVNNWFGQRSGKSSSPLFTGQGLLLGEKKKRKVTMKRCIKRLALLAVVKVFCCLGAGCCSRKDCVGLPQCQLMGLFLRLSCYFQLVCSC